MSETRRKRQRQQRRINRQDRRFIETTYSLPINVFGHKSKFSQRSGWSQLPPTGLRKAAKQSTALSIYSIETDDNGDRFACFYANIAVCDKLVQYCKMSGDSVTVWRFISASGSYKYAIPENQFLIPSVRKAISLAFRSTLDRK